MLANEALQEWKAMPKKKTQSAGSNSGFGKVDWEVLLGTREYNRLIIEAYGYGERRKKRRAEIDSGATLERLRRRSSRET